MYESHFQLRQAPFSIAPDPEFLYLSAGHREAFAHLTYGLAQGGFVLITGEVGTGKTTLLRNLLRQMPPDMDVAFILNPRLTVRELLETICDELGIDCKEADRASTKFYVDALSAHLLATHAAGRSTLVIIDEAQNLAPAVLEQIRLLTNLETDKRKLLRIMLLGQPELLDLLARKELRQLAQRITARYHLSGLNRADTEAYVIHRLQRAGGSALLFTGPALRRLYRISGGIPRLINLIADRALLGAYGARRHQVTWSMVGRAAREVLGVETQRRTWIYPAAAAVVIALALGGYLLSSQHLESSLEREMPAAQTAAPTSTQTSTPTTDSTPAAAAVIDAAPETVPETGLKTEAEIGSGIASETGPAAITATAPGTEAGLAADADGSAADSVETEQTTPARALALQRPDMTSAATLRLAHAAAFARWGKDFGAAPRGAVPCDFAPSVDLQCLGSTGTWRDLAEYDLPAVLELWDTGSTPFYATLLAMDGNVLTLALGGNVLQIETRQLAEHWFGSFVLLWRMPPGYAGSIREGDRHATVAFAREALAALGFGDPADNTSTDAPDQFDSRLRDQTIAFQQRSGLRTDGVIGPSTWIALQRARVPETPSLTAPPEA